MSHILHSNCLFKRLCPVLTRESQSRTCHSSPSLQQPRTRLGEGGKAAQHLLGGKKQSKFQCVPDHSARAQPPQSSLHHTPVAPNILYTIFRCKENNICTYRGVYVLKLWHFVNVDEILHCFHLNEDKKCQSPVSKFE